MYASTPPPPSKITIRIIQPNTAMLLFLSTGIGAGEDRISLTIGAECIDGARSGGALLARGNSRLGDTARIEPLDAGVVTRPGSLGARTAPEGVGCVGIGPLLNRP